ncbi:MAG: DMT family transporter [Rhodospirillales bacterium]
MSNTVLTAPAPAGRAAQGIGCIMAGMVLFVFQDAYMKSLLGEYPFWPLVVVRSVMTAIVLVPAILWLGRPHRLLTPYWPLHMCRAALFAVGFSLYYTAFPYMTLASVTTIFFAAPLITAVFASVFLGERIGPLRIGALVVGFGGVIVIMRPGSDSFQWVSVLPLICATTYATSQIIARKVGERETSLTMGLHTLVMAGIFITAGTWALNQVSDIGQQVPHVRWTWDGLTGEAIPALLFLGACGMVGYVLLQRAYQIADASLVAPFEYAYIPMIAILGYVVWDEVPEPTTLIGMALIVASGLFLGYRELVNARRRDETPVTAETSFVPGNPAPLPPPAED